MGIKRRLSFLKRPGVALPLAAVVLLLIAAVMAVKNLSAPAEGTINQTPPAKAETIDPYAQPGAYSGKYLSFSYPPHYKKVAGQLSGSYLEVANFGATDHSGKFISVGVTKGDVNTDSGVLLRKNQPQKYRQQPHDHSGALVFSSDIGGSERTAFIQHGDLLATISATAPAGWDLTNDLSTVTSSLKWE